VRFFSIPNTFIVAIGQVNWLALVFTSQAATKIEEAARANGLATEVYHFQMTANSMPVLKAFRSRDIWGYAFLGHGYKNLRDSSDPLIGAFYWNSSGGTNS